MTNGISLRSILPTIVLFLLGGVSLSRSSPQTKGDTWVGLPPELRQRLHMSVSELPPFPEDHANLRDIRRWPKRRTFDGDPYRIRYFELDGDVHHSLDDVQGIRRGGEYGASYRPERDRKPVRGPSGRGPSYHWAADGRLMQQGYRTKNGLSARGFDPKGRVVQFVYRETQENSWFSCSKPRGTVGIEWFDSTGSLIGFGVDGEYYWAGARKTDEEFRRLARAQDPWIALWRARGRATASSYPAPSPPPR